MVFDSILEHVTDEFAHGVAMGGERPTEKALIQEGFVRDALAGRLLQGFETTGGVHLRAGTGRTFDTATFPTVDGAIDTSPEP